MCYETEQFIKSQVLSTKNSTIRLTAGKVTNLLNAYNWAKYLSPNTNPSNQPNPALLRLTSPNNTHMNLSRLPVHDWSQNSAIMPARKTISGKINTFNKLPAAINCGSEVDKLNLVLYYARATGRVLYPPNSEFVMANDDLFCCVFSSESCLRGLIVHGSEVIGMDSVYKFTKERLPVWVLNFYNQVSDIGELGSNSIRWFKQSSCSCNDLKDSQKKY